MSSYSWATPRKAQEHYLDRVDRTPEDLWRATYDGHIRVEIMGVEFSGEQIRALLDLLHYNVPDDRRKFELPIWMSVNVDDVERNLCGERLPQLRRGRPKKKRQQINEEYRLAVSVSKLLGDGSASSVRVAAQILIDGGRVKGASDDAKHKAVQRAYRRYFRHD